MNKKYIISTIKNWHINEFYLKKDTIFKEWILITDKKELTLERLNSINPRYIFFPHWSWIVPDEIIDNFECVCFHATDVPYGRGGSPIQNLIIRGHQNTKISALKMVSEVDAGPVYLKKDLSLKGTAQGVFERSANIISDMMIEIARNEPIPLPQEGKATVFSRRGGDDNILPMQGSLEHLYNHIRMLDAASYPHSFIEHGDFKIEFSDALLQADKMEAKVIITRKT